MLFDAPHLIFSITGFFVVATLLVLCGFFVKQEKYKNLVLKLAAVFTVILHYSELWVDYLSTGSAEVSGAMLFAIYPCHIAMWLLLACAFIKNKQSKIFKIIAEFTFYLGIVGGIMGILLNEIYASNPNLADWDVLNGLLSHLTLMVGCIYLLVGRFIKIRVSNVISVACGMLFMFIDGLFVIGLFRLCGISAPNSMYILEPPLPQVPWFNTYLIGLLAVLIAFVITATYEQIRLPKEERWYSKIKNRRKI